MDIPEIRMGSVNNQQKFVNPSNQYIIRDANGTMSDIEAQRAAYSGMSKDMIELIKKEGLSGGELYVAFCPMAFNDKGAAWISTSKEIRNPYFGEKMLTCGEVKETID